MGTAVVFPLLPNGSAVSSWSYNLVAGAAGLVGATAKPSANPVLADASSSSTLSILGSSSYQAQAVSASVASGISAVDLNTTFNLNSAASGAGGSVANWLTFITGAAFSGESPTSVAVLGLGSSTDPNRAYIRESLFSTRYAAATTG